MPYWLRCLIHARFRRHEHCPVCGTPMFAGAILAHLATHGWLDWDGPDWP